MVSVACSMRRSRWHPPRAHGGAVFAARRLHCDARPGVVPDNSLRSLRSLGSDTIRQVRARSALRAPTPALRFSRLAGRAGHRGPALRQAQTVPRTVCVRAQLHKSPLPGDTCRSSTTEVFARHATIGSAKACPGRRQRACESLRSGGFLAARFSALRALTCRILFERSERSELCDGPKARAPQGSRSEAQTASPKRCRLPGRTFAEPSAAHHGHQAT
jgi:hypothetical protein